MLIAFEFIGHMATSPAALSIERSDNRVKTVVDWVSEHFEDNELDSLVNLLVTSKKIDPRYAASSFKNVKSRFVVLDTLSARRPTKWRHMGELCVDPGP